jgi:hypothetical protein
LDVSFPAASYEGVHPFSSQAARFESTVSKNDHDVSRSEVQLMSLSAGIVAMGAYLPAKTLSGHEKVQLVKHLANETLLPREFIEQTDDRAQPPGRIETNVEGWRNQPWFETWLNNLPPKKRDDPFQGTKERHKEPQVRRSRTGVLGNTL